MQNVLHVYVSQSSPLALALERGKRGAWRRSDKRSSGVAAAVEEQKEAREKERERETLRGDLSAFSVSQ